MTAHYTTDAEVQLLVAGFESCAIPKENFTHADHLTIAVAYLQTNSSTAAVQLMREGLKRFLTHHGIGDGKYHETLTVFWIEIISESLTEFGKDHSLAQKCNFVIEQVGDKNLPLSFYSPAVLASDSARTTFVEPDVSTWRNSGK